MATAEFNFPVPALTATESAFAPIEKIDGTNVDILTCAFDDATTEYRNGSFTVPTDIDTSATVTFRATGRRDTGTGAANIILRFDHLARADSEAEDTAYTSETSGALAVDTTAGDLDIFTWTETATNLGWAASETVFFRIARVGGDASDTLSGDWLWHHFTVEIPLS